MDDISNEINKGSEDPKTPQDEDELEVATAVESEEEQKEVELSDLEYADGKVRDEVDIIEEEEKIFGTDTLSPFKTADIRVFKRKLDSMSRDQMSSMAERVAARIYSSTEDQKEELTKAFYSWMSQNGTFQTSASKKAEKGALSRAFESSVSVKDLKEKLKSKTLSDLQSTAARLGFNPSFDRERLIQAIVKEYQNQS